MSDDIEIMLCENDNNGNVTGFVAAIDFYYLEESFARLETADLFKSEPCFTNWRVIDMYNTRTKYHDRREMVGNVFWNSYRTPLSYSLGFINMLSASKKWHCTEGYSSIYEKFNSGQPISSLDLDIEEEIEPRIIDLNQMVLPYDDHKHVVLDHGVATVSPDAGPEVIDALNKMANLAYKNCKK